MNNHYTYFIILAASLAGPLLLSFDRKVAFYRYWKFLFPAMIIPALLYIFWDFYFTTKGVWSFNEAYITGIKIYNLPLEEVLFFFVVPYCCVFIYECIGAYFPKVQHIVWADKLLLLLGIILFVAGVTCYGKYYTSWTFILTGVFVTALHFINRKTKFFNTGLFVVSYAVMLLPFLIVNGFLTAIPVVLYNDAENLGLRIYSIPFEDVFYGMLLILMDLAIYERLKSK